MPWALNKPVPDPTKVPATWVEWPLMVEAPSACSTRPIRSVWTASTAPESHCATTIPEPSRLSPAEPPGHTSSVEMVSAASMLLVM